MPSILGRRRGGGEGGGERNSFQIKLWNKDIVLPVFLFRFQMFEGVGGGWGGAEEIGFVL